MKKCLICLLVLLLAMTASSALAAPLTIDLETATEDELVAAQEAITAQLSKLRAAQMDSLEAVRLDGSGTSIKSGVAVPFSPARVIFSASEKGTLTLTGGKYDHTFREDTQVVDYITDPGTFEALVETAGDWQLTIEPVKQGGTLTVAGVGPYVGDFFDLSGSTIVTISADASGMDAMLSNFIVGLGHQYANIDAWQSDNLTNELLSGSDTYTADLIIKPTANRAEYFWTVKCAPGVKWSIALK